MKTGKPKLVILQTHPIQYYAPLYKALSEHGGLEVKVLYLTDSGAHSYYDAGFQMEVEWDLPLLDGYDHVILQPGASISGRGFWSRSDASLIKVLEQERPDWLLVYGYASRMNWVAILWAARHGIKIAYSSDSNGRIRRPRLRTAVKWPVVRSFFSMIAVFFSPGEANRDYLSRFGVDAERIHWCPFAIDANRFISDPSRKREIDFLWAGKLIDRKRPVDFVLALKELKHRGHSGISARLIGQGDGFSNLAELADDLKREGILELPGFVNQSMMPAEYRRAGVFVFSSEAEPYGLAATEAAAAGAALVVADGIGCVGSNSAAQPGRNALIYPTGDLSRLSDAMERLLVDEHLRTQMQSASENIGRAHDVAHAAKIIAGVLISESSESY